MDESLHCSPETVIALLISSAPKQNDLGVKKIKLKLQQLNDKIYTINRLEEFEKFKETFNTLSEDTIMFNVGFDLVPFAEEMVKSIKNSRNKIKNKTGFIIPLIRITSSKTLQENEIVVHIQGKEVFQEFIVFSKKEINKEIENIVNRIYDEHLDEIFTNEILENYISQVQRKNAWLIHDIMQILFVAEIKQLLMSLLKNGKSIKNISLIFEKISSIINCNYRWQPKINIISLEKALNNLV